MSRIYWGSNLRESIYGFWEPSILVVSRANGNFKSRWSILTLSKNHNPNKIKYAVGVSEVTPAQQAAVALDPDIFVVGEADIQKQVSALPVDTTAKIADFVQQKVKISPTGSKETAHTVFNRMSVATDNKTLTALEIELDNSLKISKAMDIGLLIMPTMLAAESHLKLYRRQLLKLGLVSAAMLLLPKTGHSSIVFNDNFSVGADIDIASYPSGTPDYAYNHPGTLYDSLYVSAVNDRVQMGTPVNDNLLFARIIDASVPTGDQKITATLFSDTGSALLAVRCATDGTINLYASWVGDDGGPFLGILRYDDGEGVIIAAEAGTFTWPGTCSFTATGAGATVDLDASYEGVAALTYADTSGTRKTSGPSGFGIYESAGDVAYIDTLSVDNLAAPPASSIRRKPILQ